MVFLSHCASESLRQLIRKEGFQLISFDQPHFGTSGLQSAFREQQPFPQKIGDSQSQWLVMDGYHFTSNDSKIMRQDGFKLLLIDDFNHLPHYHADLLLNQNLNAEFIPYHCDPDTILLLGTKYVLLRREFLKKKFDKMGMSAIGRKVLVTLGGADPENMTAKVIEALKQVAVDGLEVKIVVGPANPHLDSLKQLLPAGPATFCILPPVNNMPELMDWADIAVTAGGSTCWELAFIGVPALVFIMAENQARIAQELHAQGAAINLGWGRQAVLAEIVEALQALIHAPRRRKEMAARSRELVDGRGAGRVTQKMREPDLCAAL